MFRQAFATSSRALRSTPRITQRLTSPSVYVARSFQPIAPRWYSEAKDAGAEKPEATEAKTEHGNDELAQLKKDLETKDAEARDWKVNDSSSNWV